MKIAILLCDNVLEKFRAEFGSYDEMIRHMFNRVDNSIEFEKFDCQHGQFPEDIDAFDGYITSGSRLGAYENLAWIQQLIDFIRKLDHHNKKLIGICFGHQLIALALGQQVEKSDRGWGVGVAQNRIISRPPWMSEYRPVLNIIVSHQDQVTSITEQAIVIAESDFCPYFIVQWNPHFLSIQGHPEWQPEYSRVLMQERRSIIPPDTIESGIESLRIEPDNVLFCRWIVDFITR